MPASARDLLESALSVVLRIAGIFAAVLPARFWPTLDEHVPVTSSAVLSSILTLVAGAILGFQGFLAYGTKLAEDNTRIFLEMAARPEAVGALDSSALAGMSGLALFTFLLFTATGWATLYLCLTGLVRGVSAALADGIGDPVLTGLDAMLVWAANRTTDRVRRRRREWREGPEVPDAVVTGRSLGLSDAELVIVSSRPKAGWDRGTVVISGEHCYRIGVVIERTIGGRLRTLYPLSEHRDLEAFRRSVYYELPPLPRS